MGLKNYLLGLVAMDWLPPPVFREAIRTCAWYPVCKFGGRDQLIAGLFVMLGLLTRFAALSLAITMLVAIVKVHPDAFFAQNGGMEFPLMLLLASLSLVIGGGGRFAMDRRYAV